MASGAMTVSNHVDMKQMGNVHYAENQIACTIGFGDVKVCMQRGSVSALSGWWMKLAVNCQTLFGRALFFPTLCVERIIVLPPVTPVKGPLLRTLRET